MPVGGITGKCARKPSSMFQSFKEKESFHSLVIWLILVFWYVAIGARLFSGPAARLQSLISAQAFWLFNRPPPCTEAITIVAIDEASRRRLGMKWPWKRDVTARLVHNIAECKPRVIGLDIVFSGAGDVGEDQALIRALRSHPAVVLGYLLRKGGKDGPEEAFGRSVRAMGFVNKPVEQGTIRSIWTYRPRENGLPELSIEIAILAASLGLNRQDIRVNAGGILMGDRLFIPSPGGKAPLNYLAYHTAFRIVPAHEVLENRITVSDFRDKIVLVGATDPLLHDEFLTPLGTFPGVGILADSLAMLLSGRFIRSVPDGLVALGVLAIGMLIIWINRRLGFTAGSLATFVFVGLIYVLFVAVRAHDLVLPWFLILFCAVSAYLAYNGYKHAALLYVTSRLKNEAITDPLTGLYASRYFCLQLQERVRSRQALAFIGMRMADYDKLAVRLSFEQVQQRIKVWCDLIAACAEKAFGKVTIGRLGKDTVGIVVEGEAATKAQAFAKNLQKTPLMGPGTTNHPGLRQPLRTCVIQKAEDRVYRQVDVLGQMESLLGKAKRTQVCCSTFRDAASDSHVRIDSGDALEFIAYDWHERNKELEHSLRELLETNKKLNRLSWGALEALARAIDAKSPWTAGHSERVTAMALRIGRALKLEREDLDILRRAGLLHDIGKIATPAEILDKPGRLSPEQRRIICEHPGRGARILEPIEDFAAVVPITRQHHEWFDGTGYPDGLAGDRITLGARILAVADVFDALTSDRPYRAGMPVQRAIEIITEGRGTQFDPRVVEAFLRVVTSKKAAKSKEARHTSVPVQAHKAAIGASTVLESQH